jgi:hypothetical protein
MLVADRRVAVLVGLEQTPAIAAEERITSQMNTHSQAVTSVRIRCSMWLGFEPSIRTAW